MQTAYSKGSDKLIEKLEGVRETVMFREDFGIRLYLNCENESYPVHWHTAAEVIMPLDNLYTVKVNDESYVLYPGDILIIPPGELHEITAPDSGKRLILQFDFSLLFSLKLFDPTLHLMRPVCLIEAEQSRQTEPSLQALLLNLKDEYYGNSVLKEAAVYGLLIQFFVRLGRDVINGKSHEQQPGGRKYFKHIDTFLHVCSYMTEHCTREVKVEELAGLAGYSKFHFTRLFKQCIGLSYGEYLNRQRILVAEKLLTDPELSVTEVAMRSGFGSLATFNRTFKAYRKCTPTQYKQMYVNWHRP